MNKFTEVDRSSAQKFRSWLSETQGQYNDAVQPISSSVIMTEKKRNSKRHKELEIHNVQCEEPNEISMERKSRSTDKKQKVKLKEKRAKKCNENLTNNDFVNYDNEILEEEETTSKYRKKLNENSEKNNDTSDYTKSEEPNEVHFKRKATVADKERKRLKRQQLKETKKQKTEESKVNEKLAKQNSLNYLYLWNTDRELWSFKKKRQIWLLKYMYVKEQISDKDFEILLNYMENIQGSVRNRLLSQAENFIKVWEDQIQNVEIEGTIEEDKSVEVTKKMKIEEYVFDRARLVIQILV